MVRRLRDTPPQRSASSARALHRRLVSSSARNPPLTVLLPCDSSRGRSARCSLQGHSATDCSELDTAEIVWVEPGADAEWWDAKEQMLLDLEGGMLGGILGPIQRQHSPGPGDGGGAAASSAAAKAKAQAELQQKVFKAMQAVSLGRMCALRPPGNNPPSSARCPRPTALLPRSPPRLLPSYHSPPQHLTRLSTRAPQIFPRSEFMEFIAAGLLTELDGVFLRKPSASSALGGRALRLRAAHAPGPNGEAGLPAGGANGGAPGEILDDTDIDIVLQWPNGKTCVRRRAFPDGH